MKNKISRRQFSKLTAAGFTVLTVPSISGMKTGLRNAGCIRLGGPVWGDASDPDQWVSLLRNEGYTAAYCPVEVGTGRSHRKVI